MKTLKKIVLPAVLLLTLSFFSTIILAETSKEVKEDTVVVVDVAAGDSAEETVEAEDSCSKKKIDFIGQIQNEVLSTSTLSTNQKNYFLEMLSIMKDSIIEESEEDEHCT